MKSIVYTFGRFSPPTVGHERLIKTVVEAAKLIGGDHVVYISQTHKAPADPLDWNFKRRVCETAFRGVNISSDISIRNPYIALETLKESYDNIVMVAGSDRIENYLANFAPYAREWRINFNVVSAGQRIMESENIDGISASKLRQYAAEGNKEQFFNGLPTSLNENIKRLVYNNVRRGLK
jgi:nicotinic acid mononucleotide adenylyltransferase